MNYERERRNINARTIMDIGMGIFYMAVGGLLVATRSFANIAIPVWAAYLIGGMLLVGGGARLYKGIKTAFPEKK